MSVIPMLINAISPQALQSVASALGESFNSTRQGMLDALPAMFSGIINKGSTASGAASILSLMQDRSVDSDVISRLTTDAQASVGFMRQGGSIAQSLLGPQLDSTTAAIATHAGISKGSAQSLLALAAPLALGGIAKAAPQGGFTPNGLMNFLQTERDDVLGMLPAGIPGAASAARTAIPVVPPVRRRRMDWLPLAVGLGAAALFALFLSNQRKPAPVTQDTIPVVVQQAAPTPAAPPLSTLTLPGGITLSVPAGSIGEQLSQFLGNSLPAPRTFAFRDLNFDTGDVVVTAESTATLDTIAALLHAYPNATVRLDGHTDTVGERAANVKLSLDRANSVARALVARGVDQGRISTAGFGPDKPIATNETDAGRAQNRRLELTVLTK